MGFCRLASTRLLIRSYESAPLRDYVIQCRLRLLDWLGRSVRLIYRVQDGLQCRSRSTLTHSGKRFSFPEWFLRTIRQRDVLTPLALQNSILIDYRTCLETPTHGRTPALRLLLGLDHIIPRSRQRHYKMVRSRTALIALETWAIDRSPEKR